MEHRSRIAIALMCLLAPTTFSAPTTSSSCISTCNSTPNADSKIKYQPGQSYSYNFETEVITKVVGSTDDTSRIQVKGQAVISAVSSCDFELTLNKVSLTNPGGQAASNPQELEGSSLKFSYENGEIQSLCVATGDSPWSTNVKRSIISMLTNKASEANTDHVEVIESDVSGRCPTSYKVTGSTYVKTRRLNSCTNRDGGNLVEFGVPYDNIRTKSNSVSLIDSLLICTQELSGGLFTSVSCLETHKIPFLSTASTGVQTEIRSSLTFLSAKSGIQSGPKAATIPATTFYDHSPTAAAAASSPGKSVDILNKICGEIKNGAITSRITGLYLQLIKALRSTSKDSIQSSYDLLKKGGLCSSSDAAGKVLQLLVDAAASAGSDGSIAFLASLIGANEAGLNAETLFHTFTSFAARPGTAALSSMIPLISGKEVDSEYLLTASGLGHQYCSKTNAGCAGDPGYSALVDKIAERVRVPPHGQDERGVVAALQALGNLDQLTPSAVTAIGSLLDGGVRSERLMVRALDAFRRDPCQPVLKGKAHNIFSDKQKSTHVRIQAYLTLAKCLKEGDVGKIQSVLEIEESNQVGSFVATHIENVLESASPTKDSQKETFKQFSIPPQFRRNYRKFSRNSELSGFWRNANVGGSLEGNLIFSQDSYIPRIATANFTVDAFGRSYNFLELGVYAEEFEFIAERLFGPTGTLRSSSSSSLLANGKEKLSNLIDNVRSRFRRDLSTTPNDIGLSSLRSDVHIEERTGDDGIGDIYIRVFGTSIIAESIDLAHLQEGSGSLSNNVAASLQRILAGDSANSKWDVTQPITFLDEELVLPTISGFPLNLKVEGSSVFSLAFEGNLDLPTLFKQSSSDMTAKIIPSAATLLKSKMTVGSGPLEAGVQLEGKLHSSTGVELKLVRSAGKFEFRFNLPEEKTQVIEMRTDVYWVEQSAGDSLERRTPIASKLPTKSFVENECTSALSRVLGLQLCSTMSIPTVSRSAPIPFLNGPSIFSLSILKSEASMEGYYMKIEKNSSDSESLGLSFLLDTPGSKTVRKVTAEAQASKYSSSSPHYSFKLDSPWTKLELDYKRSWTEALKGVELKASSDGSLYSARAQLKRGVGSSAGSTKYEPILSYKVGGGKAVKLIEGQVIQDGEGSKVVIDLRSSGPLKAFGSAGIKGTLEYPPGTPEGFSMKASALQLSSEVLGTVEVDAALSKLQGILSANAALKYGSGRSATFEGRFGKPALSKYEAMLHTRFSQFPSFNLDVSASSEKAGDVYSSEFSYGRGPEGPSRVSLSHNIEGSFTSSKKFQLSQESTLHHPFLRLDAYGKISAKAVPGAGRDAQAVLTINSFNSSALYESSGDNFWDYSFKANAAYSGKTYEFSEISTKVGDDKQNFKTRIGVNPGFWYAANTDLTTKFDKSDMEAMLSTSITSDQFTSPIVLKTGVRGKADGYQALLKYDAQGKNYADLSAQYKYAKGPKPAALLAKASLPSTLDAKFNHTFSWSKSDSVFDLKWIPSGRKIEWRSSLGIGGEQVGLDASLKWDAEKDPSKEATIKSRNTVSLANLRFDSKNEIAVLAQLASVNAKGALMKEAFNGNNSLQLEYISPAGSSYSFSSSLFLENKLKSKTAALFAALSLPNEASPIRFSWENRVLNLDWVGGTFDASSEIKADYKGEKDVSLRADLGSSLPGNFRSYSAKVGATGSLLRNVPYAASFKADMKRGKFSLTSAVNKGTTKGDLAINMNYDVWGAVKKTLDLNYTVNTPFEYLEKLEGGWKHGLLFNGLKNFEYNEEGHIAFNEGAPASWKHSSSFQKNVFKYASEFTNEGQSIYSTALTGEFSSKKVLLDASATVKGTPAFLHLAVDNAQLKMGAELKGGVGSKSYQISGTHEKTGPGQYEVDIFTKASDSLLFRLTNKYELSGTKNSFDLMLAAADLPTRRFLLSLTSISANKWGVESLIRWGEGDNYLSTKGDLTLGASAAGSPVDANLSLEAPNLKTNKLSLKASKVDGQGGKTSLQFKVKDAGVEKFSAVLDYGAVPNNKPDDAMYEGTLTVLGDKSLFSVDFVGKLRLEDSSLARARGDVEDGRELKGTFEIGKASAPAGTQGSLLLKYSDKEKRTKGSYCAGATCKSGDIQLLSSSDPAIGELEYSLRIVGESGGGGQNSTRGISMLSRSTEYGRQLEHTVMLIISQDPGQVGYRLYRKDGNELGLELLLPERTIASVAEFSWPAPTDFGLQLSFFVDKMRKPERKVSLSFSTEAAKGGQEGFGRELSLVLKHPDVTKELKVGGSYQIGGDALVILRGTIDVFKAGSEILVTYRMDKDEAHNGLSSEWAVTSQGQNIDFGGKSLISREGGKISYKHELHYKNKDKVMNTASIDSSISVDRLSFEITGSGSTKWVSLITSFETKSDVGYTLRQTLLLPGMDESRIISATLHTASPIHAHARLYAASTPKVHLEAIIGFKGDEDHFVAGLYDHQEDGKKVLADLNIALNHSRVLFVKSNWERENFQGVLLKAQGCGESTLSNLKTLTSSGANEIFKEVGAAAGNLRKSIPNFSPAVQGAQNDWADLVVELDAHEDTKFLLIQLQTVQLYAKKGALFVFYATKGLRKTLFHALATFRENYYNKAPELLSSAIQNAPITIRDIKLAVEWIVTNALSVFQAAAQLWNQGVDCLNDAMPELISLFNKFLDLAAGVKNCVRGVLSWTLNNLTTLWSCVRSFTNNVVDHDLFQLFLKDGLSLLNSLLTDVIEETKIVAEGLRTFILRYIPEGQLQQFFQSIAEYVEKKSKGVGVDDAAAIRDISSKFFGILKDLLTRIFNIEGDEGFFLARIPLPEAIQSLRDLPKLFERFSLTSLPSVKYNVPSYRVGLKELFNKIKSRASLDEFVPPYPGHALLIGSQHYKTFDGAFYNFNGNCQYLLASDFEDANFTIVVDFDRKEGGTVERALIIKDRQNKVAITSDNTVEIDDKKYTADTLGGGVAVGHFNVDVRGDWIVVGNDRGVKMGCSISQDVCAAKVNGYYQGKVFGLWGKFNHEQYDDMITPNGQIVDNVNDFVSSWKIESGCQEFPVITTPAITSEVVEACAAAFDSKSSTLRPCYGVVDPRPYQRICESLSSSPGYDDVSKSVCTASSGYAKSCFLSYASVDLPDTCKSL